MYQLGLLMSNPILLRTVHMKAAVSKPKTFTILKFTPEDVLEKNRNVSKIKTFPSIYKKYLKKLMAISFALLVVISKAKFNLN